jgi:hypothetical protein
MVARGTPEDLGDRESRPATVSFRLPEGVTTGELPVGGAASTNGGRTVSLDTSTPVATLNELTGWALRRGFDLENLEVTRPSLEDVYLSLTSEGSE